MSLQKVLLKEDRQTVSDAKYCNEVFLKSGYYEVKRVLEGVGYLVYVKRRPKTFTVLSFEEVA